jgi:hypothetical protein
VGKFLKVSDLFSPSAGGNFPPYGEIFYFDGRFCTSGAKLPGSATDSNTLNKNGILPNAKKRFGRFLKASKWVQSLKKKD